MYNKFQAFMIICIIFIQGCDMKNRGSETENSFVSVYWPGMPAKTTYIFDSLYVTDPFILADEATKIYYMTGSGGLLWKSPDLYEWEGPYSLIEVDTNTWIGSDPKILAPQIQKYKNKYYCFTTFANNSTIIDTIPGRCDVFRCGAHILIADRVEGPYRPINDEIYLPEEWTTLDGTIWEEEGVPYLVYSHDWMQLVDGQIKYVPLSGDLSHSSGNSKIMFSASDAVWVREMRSIGELTFGMSLDGYVSDGPFLFKTGTGRLGMLWSSWSDKRYAQGVAYSESGLLEGPWIQEEKPIVESNSGHGMIFSTFEGKTLLLLHSQGLEMNPGPRKPILYEVDLSGDFLTLGERYHP